MDPDQTTKVCTGCARALPLAAYRFKRGSNKHVARCRGCEKVRKARRAVEAARQRPVQAHTNNAKPARTCARRGCGAPVAGARAGWSRHCSRACLLLSIGLPATWDAKILDRATEAQIRGVLGAVFAVVRADLPATVGGAR